MKRLLWLAALCGMAAFLGPGASAKGKTDRDVFKSLIDEYWATWSTGDVDKVGAYYDQSPDAVYYDVSPLKYAGWSEYKEGVKHIFDEANSVKIGANDDLKATRRGAIAWTSETFHMSEALKTGKTVELQGRHTAVWEKRAGKWIIVHEHVSIPMN